MDNLIDTPEHTLKMYKNGLAYCLVNKCERKDVFFQGDDAEWFWVEFNRFCLPNRHYAEVLRRLCGIYSSVAQPCRT